MLWLIIIIISYSLFAVVSTGDKYLLSGPPNPKIYCFYIGFLSVLVLFLIPFVGFSLPNTYEIIFSLFAGSIYLLAIFSTYQGLEYFEASRIIPAIGGFAPIFTLIFIYIFSFGREVPGIKEFLALFFLIIGSVLISSNFSRKFPFKSLGISALAAVFLSLAFILSKYVYNMLPFWTGFILIRTGVIISALSFLLSRKFRKEIFGGKPRFNKKTTAFFIVNQIFGAGAFILQSWAIALAPIIFLPIISALQGIQYFLLFIFSLFLFKILKEDVSKKIIVQKIVALLFIIIGLILL